MKTLITHESQSVLAPYATVSASNIALFGIKSKNVMKILAVDDIHGVLPHWVPVRTFYLPIGINKFNYFFLVIREHGAWPVLHISTLVVNWFITAESARNLNEDNLERTYWLMIKWEINLFKISVESRYFQVFKFLHLSLILAHPSWLHQLSLTYF